MASKMECHSLLEEHEGIDQALYSGIVDIVEEEDANTIWEELDRRLAEGNLISHGQTLLYYDMAMDLLASAGGWSRSDPSGQYEGMMSEAEKCLWAARCENYRALLERLTQRGCISERTPLSSP